MTRGQTPCHVYVVCNMTRGQTPCQVYVAYNMTRGPTPCHIFPPGPRASSTFSILTQQKVSPFTASPQASYPISS